MTRGPSVSIWFLRHFGCSTKNESIIGDLVEQYQQGRSRVWYWRQVFIAILVSFVTEIRLNKLLAVRALLIGNVLKISSLYFLPIAWGWWIGPHPWESPNRFIVLGAVTIVLCASSARLVAWLHRPHERAMVLLLFLWELSALFALPGHLRAPFFWIDAFPSILNIILWNTGGLTALDSLCTVCTSSHTAYRNFLLGAGVVLTTVSLLLGSGLLSPSSSNSRMQEKQAAT